MIFDDFRTRGHWWLSTSMWTLRTVEENWGRRLEDGIFRCLTSRPQIVYPICHETRPEWTSPRADSAANACATATKNCDIAALKDQRDSRHHPGNVHVR